MKTEEAYIISKLESREKENIRGEKTENGNIYAEIFVGKLLDKRPLIKVNLACQHFHTKDFSLKTLGARRHILIASNSPRKERDVQNTAICAGRIGVWEGAHDQPS